MRILQVSAELFPLLKTGGLADVAGALPLALAAAGEDVRVLLPGFPALRAGVHHAAQVAGLGLDEILDRDAVVLLEWAERFPELLPDERTEIRLTPEGESGRRIEIRRLPGK